MPPTSRGGEQVGVLTLHRCINNGSYWQARCLVEGLRARGAEAVVLDHRARRIDILEWRCALRPTLPTPVQSGDSAAYRKKIRQFERAIAALPLSQPFELERTTGLEALQTVVVGSDEVWNLQHPFYCGQTLFFGHGLEHVRRVSYAASFGNYDACNGLGDPWAGWLREFSAISVRDENSQRLVTAAVGAEPDLVLDPCLQFPSSPEGEWGGADEPFVVVYGHNFTQSFVDAVGAWARVRRLPLVSVGYRNDWADVQWLDAGPHDFAHAMARAEAVATNFFHGSVFALRYEKPFVAETTPYRSHKVRSLMNAIGGGTHLVSDSTPQERFDLCLDEPVAPAILDRVADLRSSSDRYLAGALG